MTDDTKRFIFDTRQRWLFLSLVKWTSRICLDWIGIEEVDQQQKRYKNTIYAKNKIELFTIKTANR